MNYDEIPDDLLVLNHNYGSPVTYEVVSFKSPKLALSTKGEHI
jgi:hypothetical protein